jgi:hypothetical protein
MKRVWALTAYIVVEFSRSLTALLMMTVVAAFYLVAILGVTGGIDQDYFALVVGGFFGIFGLVLAIVIADRAFHAKTYLLFYRLPSRSMFLAAVAMATIAVCGVLELAVSVLSLPRLTVPLPTTKMLDVIPVWLSWLILGVTLGLHLSELVRRGWSRAVAYGLLGFIVFSLNQQQSGAPVGFTDRFSWIPRLTANPVRWEWAVNSMRVIIWPVNASIQVVRSTAYSTLQSLSPAMIVVISILVFGLASSLFGRKDLVLPEG